MVNKDGFQALDNAILIDWSHLCEHSQQARVFRNGQNSPGNITKAQQVCTTLWTGNRGAEQDLVFRCLMVQVMIDRHICRSWESAAIMVNVCENMTVMRMCTSLGEAWTHTIGTYWQAPNPYSFAGSVL